MVRSFYLFIFVIILIFFEREAIAETIHIKVVTEEAYKSQYMENGVISGPATKLVRKVLDTANIEYTIEVLPWARAYHLATTEPNVLIYSIAKTKVRANEFKWIGRIMALDYYLYGSKQLPVRQTTPIDIIKQLRVGSVRDSAMYQYFKAENFKHITTVVHGKQNFSLHKLKRIDLFPANKSSFEVICIQLSLDCSLLKPLYKLDVSPLGLYMAFSNATSDKIVDKVKLSYQRVIEKQEF